MELAALVLEYLRVLVWPLVVLAVMLIFRVPLVKLIDRVRSWSGFGHSFEFADEVHDANERSKVIAESANVPTEQPSERRDVNEGDSAVGVIISAWAGFEQAAAQRAFDLGLGLGSRPRTGLQIVDALQRNGAASADTYRLAQDLQRMRNEVAHGLTKPTKAAADDFADAAMRLSLVLVSKPL